MCQRWGSETLFIDEINSTTRMSVKGRCVELQTDEV